MQNHYPSHQIESAEIFGLRATRQVKPEDYIRWATDMLLAGHDSRGLRILAGLPKLANSFEAEEHFGKAMRELGLVEPGEKKAIEDYGLFLTHQIVAGEILPESGVKALSDLWLFHATSSKTLYDWYHLNEEIDLIRQGITRSIPMEDIDTVIVARAHRFIGEHDHYSKA